MRLGATLSLSSLVVLLSCGGGSPLDPVTGPVGPDENELELAAKGNPTIAQCLKQTPTISGDTNDDDGGATDGDIDGTAGNDVILGTKFADIIYGNGGLDSICGGDGDDEIHGGADDDDVLGGNGNDDIYGDAGNDRLQGEAGIDTLYGGDGDDILVGGDGNDALFGEGDDDTLGGSPGDDALDGGGGSNTCDGGGDAGDTEVNCVTVTAVDDAYDAIGNFTTPVSAPGVLSNDISSGGPLSADAETVATYKGGSATIDADGSFTYLSPAGFIGVDSFDYTVQEGASTDTGLVVMTVGSRVWYVDNEATAPGDGRDVSAFAALASAEAPSGIGDMIFVDEGDGTTTGYDAGFALKNTQALIGSGITTDVTATLNSETVTLFSAAGDAPEITRSTAGTTIALASGNTLQGLSIASTNGAGISGGAVGSLFVNPTSVAAVGGPALDVSASGALNATFASLSSSNSATHGIRLVGVTGTMTASGGAISEATSEDVLVSGGTANVTYDGTITDDLGTLVSITGTTGGTKDFNGAITDGGDGDGSGISLNTNTGATINFDGGLTLSTGVNPAFTATGGGTVNVTSGAVSTTATTTTGTAVNMASTTIGGSGVTFDTVSTSGAANGILLDGVGAGTFDADGGAIVNAIARGVDVNGGSGGVSYDGTISTTAAGRSVEVTSHTGGTVAFGGAIDDNGLGINLTSNTGATINFTGGLDIDSGANTGFNATGGGTVNATQNNTSILNTIETTTGTGLDVENTTIGSSGLTFRSISVNPSGAAATGRGIVLLNTGSTAGLTVVGDGTNAANGSGGEIANLNGADGSTGLDGGTGFCVEAASPFDGVGVYLNDTKSPTLRSMDLHDFQNFGILGFDVNGFELTGVTVTASGIGMVGTNAGTDDGPVHFCDVSGTATMSNVTASRGIEDNFVVHNDAVTLTSLTVTSSTFSTTTAGSPGNDGFLIRARGTGNVTATLTGSTFSDNFANGLQAATENSGIIDLTVDGGTFTSNNIGINVSNQGVPAGATQNFTFDLSDASITGHATSASPVNVFTGALSNANSTMEGTIDNLTINNSNSGTGPGIFVQNNGNSKLVLEITNNTISGINGNNGIDAAAKNGSPDMDLTIDNNVITVAGTVNAIAVAKGAAAGDNPALCARIEDNTTSATGAFADDIRVRNRFGAGVFGLTGYGGLAADATAVGDHLDNNNTTGNDSSAQIVAGTGGFVNQACVTP